MAGEDLGANWGNPGEDLGASWGATPPAGNGATDQQVDKFMRSLALSDIQRRAANVGYSGLSPQQQSVLDANYPSSKASATMSIDDVHRLMDARASGANGPREVATAVADSQRSTGEIPGAMQTIFPGATTQDKIAALDGSDPQGVPGDPFRSGGFSPFLGDMASMLGRSVKGLGSGIGNAILEGFRQVGNNAAEKKDPVNGILPVMARAFGESFQGNMASPTGILGSPSSALFAIPPLRASQGFAALGAEGLAARSAAFEASHPFLAGAAFNAPYGFALGEAGDNMNKLGGGERLPVALPDASAAMMLSPRTIGSLVASGGAPVATQPTRGLGQAMAAPAMSMLINGVGGGLAEAGLHWIPGVNAIIDREMKYALKKHAASAGREMTGRLAEVVDEANRDGLAGIFGLGGLRGGVKSIEGVGENARGAAGAGYGAVGNAIAPNTTRAGESFRPIITDPAHPLYGHPMPDPSMNSEWLGWVAPPGREAELNAGLGSLRAVQSLGSDRPMPGVISGYNLPEGAYLDVGRGVPATLNDLYQEARQNMFQKAAHGHPAYASEVRDELENALEAKFRSAHGLQGEPQLFRGPVPAGEQVSPLYWSDLSALRVPANVRSGNTLRANGAQFQNEIRNELGDVVTQYMYGRNAAIDRAGVRETLNEAAKKYKFAKLAEQLSVEDATKRVGQEAGMVTFLRNWPAFQYRIPMAARELGLKLQKGAAPYSAGASEGR